MTTYRFQPVRAYRTLTGTCPACEKRVTRSRTFEHTINPYNRNDDSTIRTPEQVREAVEAEADMWVPDFRHFTQKCRGEL